MDKVNNQPDTEVQTSHAESRKAQILSGLNQVQKEAVMHRNGPVVVFSGAGSGKTRIITNRIAYLIETGTAPWEILAVTFTNKAAGEMRQRVLNLTPFANRCTIATFHSACARWLREFAPELGFSSDFTIYDDDDAMAALKYILRQFNLPIAKKEIVYEYRAAIHQLKTLAILPGDVKLKEHITETMPDIIETIYKHYQEYLAACNAMDFSDLLMNMLLLLRRNEHVRQKLQQRYRYILVDEYQDTNKTQFELLWHLAQQHRNLFVVGDDDQSIYSWRGAIPSNILDFDKHYPDAKNITMAQNYRCSAHIVNAANAMIAHNIRRFPKQLFTENPDGHLIEFHVEYDGDIEADWIAEQIIEERADFDYQNVAIFYRTNSQSRLLEDALRRKNIPYQIFGNVRFYDRLEIKDMLAFMRCVVNPHDDISAKRIINVPARGIGKKAVETIEDECKKRDLPFLETVRQLVQEQHKLTKKIGPFIQTIDKLQEQFSSAPLGTVLEIILKQTAYMDYLFQKFPEQAADKADNVHELGTAIASFANDNPEATLTMWLQSVTLTSNDSNDGQGVSMMTLHMAKGLEYRRVFVTGLEEGLLPHNNSMDDEAMVEEERRLFYVGMTRAREKLTLTCATRRRLYSNYTANNPSRFLQEVPTDHIKVIGFMPHFEQQRLDMSYNNQAKISYSDQGVTYDYEDDHLDDHGQSQGQGKKKVVAEGSQIQHPTYGRGLVLNILEEFGTYKAVVDFEEFGIRKVPAHHLS